MDWSKIRDYQEKFFKEEWIDTYSFENPLLVEKILKKSNLLVNNQLLFNDAMDMEPVYLSNSIKNINQKQSPNTDPEWFFMRSRQGFLVELAFSYKLTKNKKYLKKWKELVFEFIEKNNPKKDEFQHYWRNIDTGIRLSNWIKSFIYLFPDLKLSQQEEKVMEQSLKEQVSFLKQSFVQKNWLSNWGVLAVSGILSVAIVLPNLVSERIENWAWSILEEQISLQFYDDGVQWEQSPLYQHEVIMSLVSLLIHGEYTDYIFPFNLRLSLSKPINAAHFFADQNDLLNPINDSDHADFSYIYDAYRKLGFLPQKKKSSIGRYVVGGQYPLKKVKEPVIPEVFDEFDSGFYAYKNDKYYLTLSNGRHGSGHGHATTGGLTLNYMGVDLLIDGGRFTYLDNSPIRELLKSEEYHNTIIINDVVSTEIEGSWNYKRVANPLGGYGRQKSGIVNLEAVWNAQSLKNGISVLKRNILLLDDLGVVISYNTYQCSGEGIAKCYYHLGKKVDIEMDNVNKNRAIITYDDNQSQFYTTSSRMVTTTTFSSEVYNQLHQVECLITQNEFCNAGFSIDCFLQNKEILIEEIAVYQDGTDETNPTTQVKGIKLTNRTNQKNSYFYFTPQDVYKGNKLFISEQGHHIYGEVVYFNEDKQRIRIK